MGLSRPTFRSRSQLRTPRDLTRRERGRSGTGGPLFQRDQGGRRAGWDAGRPFFCRCILGSELVRHAGFKDYRSRTGQTASLGSQLLFSPFPFNTSVNPFKVPLAVEFYLWRRARDSCPKSRATVFLFQLGRKDGLFFVVVLLFLGPPSPYSLQCRRETPTVSSPARGGRDAGAPGPLPRGLRGPSLQSAEL